MPSDARLAKSNARDEGAPLPSPIVAVGSWRPLRTTRLYSGPRPRTVTNEPSPFDRSIDTPVMRCSDSARLVSGNLPMSSAEIASTMPWPSRLMSAEARKLARMPVTTMSSLAVSAGSVCGVVAGISEGPVVPSVELASCAHTGVAPIARADAPITSRDSARALKLRIPILPYGHGDATDGAPVIDNVHSYAAEMLSRSMRLM